MKSSKSAGRQSAILRLVDANINRFSEGARVVEDIARFIMNNPRLTRGWKKVRHDLRRGLSGWPITAPASLFKHRRVQEDVGKGSTAAELTRRTVTDILLANTQRMKESLRVLEEFAKLYDPAMAAHVKSLRYRVYTLEKSSLEIVSRLCHN